MMKNLKILRLFKALCHLTDLKDYALYAAIAEAPETVMCALHELESYFWREKLKNQGGQ